MKYSFPAFENGFVRAAAATPALHVADCAYNAQQIIDAMSVYAAQGVQLICFPEFCLTGYTCSDLFLQQPLQRAAEEALRSPKGPEEIERMHKAYDERRRHIVSRLNAIDGLKCVMPKGAFYVFPCIKSTGLSSEEFCERLIYSERVAVVPGTAFGECGEGFIRVSYSYSLKHLTEALGRMKRFVASLRNEGGEK